MTVDRAFGVCCSWTLIRERIESGWWDGGDIARDYFIARNSRGLKLWVFRELRGQRRWFLHGIFG